MKTFKSKDGTTIAYDVRGMGPVLIYITGAICYRNFKPVIEDAEVFAKEFTVYTYDRRGRGDSGDTQPYSVEREVEDIEALINLIGEKAALYGHSSGAVLALETALRKPEKVSKVLLYDVPYVPDQAEQASYSVLTDKIKQQLSKGQNGPAIRSFLVGIGMPRIFAYLLPLMPGWKTMKALAPTLSYDLLLTGILPPTQRASQIVVPIEIIYGEKSPASLKSVATQLAQAIPKVTLRELKKQDHMVNAEVLLPLLLQFFKSPSN